VRQVVGALSDAERDLLSAKLAALAHGLEPGLVRLNWNSRGIDDFVGKAGAAVHEFRGVVNQVGVGPAALYESGASEPRVGGAGLHGTGDQNS
jgi:hypothetical protein